jgi:hypothetical protein
MLLIISNLTPILLQLALSLAVFLCFLVTSRKTKQTKNLEKKNEDLLNAVLFLLKLEEEHCRNNKDNFGKTLRNTMRQHAEVESQIVWNSKFSHANCVKELKKIKDNKSKNKNFYGEALQSLLLKAAK